MIRRLQSFRKLTFFYLPPFRRSAVLCPLPGQGVDAGDKPPRDRRAGDLTRGAHSRRQFIRTLAASALGLLAALCAPPGRLSGSGAPGARIRALELRGAGAAAVAPRVATGSFRSPFAFQAAGMLWQGAAPAMQLRTRGEDGDWLPWQDVRVEDDLVARSGDSVSALLLFPPTREAELRVASDAPGPLPGELRLIAIDASSGPTMGNQLSQGVEAAQAPPTPTRPTGPLPAPTSARPGPPPSPFPAQPGVPRIITRAEWGADPDLLTWPAQHAAVRKFVVHHTATSDGGANPAAALRAIYYYHAVTLGWGDIGYNYVIDRAGNVYEGRAGGPNTIASHTEGFSTSVDGIGLLGTFQDQPPPPPMLASLAGLIALRARAQRIDPQASGLLADRMLPNVFAHRDVNSTDCPGDAAFATLPAVRQRAAALAGGPVTRPSLMVVGARVTPQAISSGDVVRIDVTVRNGGSELLTTQGPPPETTYREGESYLSAGHPEQFGRIRIGAELDEPGAPDHPLRWGLGSDLGPGESRTVTGFVRLERPGPHTLSVGVVHESIEWLHRNLVQVTVAVWEPGAASYAAPGNPATSLFFPLMMRENHGWTSRLYLTNASDRVATGSLAFLDGSGWTAATIPLILPRRRSVQYELAALGGLGAGFTGSAVIRTDVPLVGIAFHERPGADRVAAEPFSAGASRLYAPLAARHYHGLSTGAQVQNLGSAPTTASITYIAVDGASWTETARIAPLAAATFYAPAALGLPDGFVGAAIIESDDGQPLAAQINEVRTDGLAMAYSAQSQGSPSAAVPLLYRNRNGWSSGIQVLNLGSATTVRVTYIRTNGPGGPWEDQATLGHAIAGTFYLPAHPELPDDLVASATVTSLDGQPLLVLANSVNAAKRIGAAVMALSQPAAALHVPAIFNNVEGWRTGLQVQNRAAQPAGVSLLFMDTNGAPVVQLADVIPGSAAKTYYVPSVGGLPEGFVGSLVIRGGSGALLSAVVNDTR